MIVPAPVFYEFKSLRSLGFFFIVVIFILFSGCVKPYTGFIVKPQSFEVTPEVFADENTEDVTMHLNGTMLVSYPWTPEEGRFWRVSVTNGLFVTGDRYIPYPGDVPTEVSGAREWMVQAISPGPQTFVATLRPRANSWNQNIIQYKITVFVIDNQ